MPVATFDTLKFARTLKEAGVPEMQAEAQAVAFAEVIHINLKELVTKDDLKREIDDLREELKQEIADMRKDAKHEMKEMEQRLTANMELSEQRLTGSMELSAARYRNEQLVIRWMLGATFTSVLAVIGLLIRLLFMLSR